MTIETKNTDIHGLNCPNYALKLERAIGALRGVCSAQIEFETETVTLEYDPAAVSLDQIVSRITDITCEPDCFDITATNRSFGIEEQESNTDWTPADHGRGCCQIGMEEEWCLC